MTREANSHSVTDALESHIDALSAEVHVAKRDDWPRCQVVARRIAGCLRSDLSLPDLADLRALPQPSAALMARILACVLASTSRDDIGTSAFGRAMISYAAATLAARNAGPALLYETDAPGVPYLPHAGQSAALRVTGLQLTPLFLAPDY